MDIQTMTKFFMWCTILNAGLLVFSTLIWRLAADLIYKVHGKWFPMPRERFNMVYYTILGLYKISVVVLNLVPWLALILIG